LLEQFLSRVCPLIALDFSKELPCFHFKQVRGPMFGIWEMEPAHVEHYNSILMKNIAYKIISNIAACFKITKQRQIRRHFKKLITILARRDVENSQSTIFSTVF
jgi:hypothetical protein